MLLEVVERLCEVTKLLVKIVDRQAITIEQSNIAAAVKEELEELRDNAKAELSQALEKYKGK